jgi:uncharacterized protein YjiS (DUF1127 family)
MIRLGRYLACWRGRLRLRELDEAQLKDVGLSRADVERECRRWPWDCRTD